MLHSWRTRWRWNSGDFGRPEINSSLNDSCGFVSHSILHLIAKLVKYHLTRNRILCLRILSARNSIPCTWHVASEPITNRPRAAPQGTWIFCSRSDSTSTMSFGLKYEHFFPYGPWVSTTKNFFMGFERRYNSALILIRNLIDVEPDVEQKVQILCGAAPDLYKARRDHSFYANGFKLLSYSSNGFVSLSFTASSATLSPSASSANGFFVSS